MTAFDGRGAAPAHPADPDGPLRDPGDAVSGVPDRDHPDPQTAPEPAVAPNLFALLAEKGEEAAQGARLASIYGFERNFILMCRSDIQEPEFKKYQRASIPKNKRKSQNISPWEVEQRIMAQQLLYGTATELWILTDPAAGTYQMMPATKPNPLDCPEILGALREVTPYGALQKLFGKNDSLLIKAGQRLQVAAAWLDRSVLGSDDDDLDDDDDDIVDSGADPTRGRS